MSEKITNEEYEEAQNIVWEYEDQIEKEANEANKSRVKALPICDVRQALVAFNEWAAKDSCWFLPATDEMINEFLGGNL